MLKLVREDELECTPREISGNTAEVSLNILPPTLKKLCNLVWEIYRTERSKKHEIIFREHVPCLFRKIVDIMVSTFLVEEFNKW